MIRNKKPYMVRVNPKNDDFLSNEEVFCRNCGLNFGDIYTLQKHRSRIDDTTVICLEPDSVNMKAHVNTYASVVWKFSKW
jgi:hypothetical protein